MFGEIQLEEMTKMPQDVASAWSGVEGWTGSSFKAIAFLGRQTCKGVNYWFLAEETPMTETPKKKTVIMAINGFKGKYAIVPSSIQEVEFTI